MAIQLPSIQYLRGYDSNPDIVGRFKSGYEFGGGIADERNAQDALGDYVKSLYQGGSAPAPRPSSTIEQMVLGSGDAAQSAVDPATASGLDAYIAKARAAESGGNDAAKNPNSSATGRYQFLDSTWQGLMQSNPELGLTPDGRTDPAQQEKAMRALTSQNARALQAKGIPVNPGSLYAAHFLGAGGASSVLGLDDSTPMVAAVPPEVIQANPNLQSMTVGDFKQWTARQGGGDGGGYQAPLAPQSQPQAATGNPDAGNGLPPREVLAALFRNPVTREFAAGMVKAAQTGDPAQKPTDDMREYAFAAAQGFKGSFADWLAQNKSAGVTVNTGDNSGAFLKKADETAATRMSDYVSSGNDAEGFMGDLRALTDLGKTVQTGKKTEILNALGPYAEAVGIKIDGLDDSQAYDAIISRMAPAMRAPGSGASSDFDAKQFLKSLPSLGNTPDGNRVINEVFQGIQVRKIKAAEIASQALDGTLKWQEADKQIRALGDPYSAFKEFQKANGETGGVATMGEKPAAPKDDAEYNALPSGTLFIDPDDGKTYRKP